MTNDDVLYAYRLRVLASARELGSVAAACRLYGIHRSTYYRWKAHGRALRPRDPAAAGAPPPADAERDPGARRAPHHRLRPRALPATGPARIASELARREARRLPGLGQRRLPRAAPPRPRTRGRCATGCSPATPRRRSRPASPSPSATSRSTTPASSCRSTASASAASPAPRASSGSTPRSTPPRASPGPSCT